jgi:cytochrome P450
MPAFVPPKPRSLSEKPGLLTRIRASLASSLALFRTGSYSGLGVSRFSIPTAPRLARRWLYTLRDPVHVREVLVGRPRDFPKSVLMGSMLRSLTGDSIFTTNGETWRRQRDLIDPALEQARIRESFARMRDAADAALMDLDRRAAGDRDVLVDDAMTRFAADVIFRTLFSCPIDPQSGARTFAAFETFQRLADAHGMVRLSGLPTFVFPGSLPAIFAAWRIRRELWKPLGRRLEEQRAGAPPMDDILGALLRAGAEGDGFSPRELLDQICMLFLAGHETSASAMAWALYLLANSPEDQARVRAEVEAAAGDAPLEFEHLRRLDFTRDVFREAMRLYPPVAFVARDTVRNETLGNRRIDPRSVIFIAPWLMHRNSLLWEAADEFRPCRFSTPEGRAAMKSAYIPFSQGERVCPGAAFALQEGVMALAMTVRAFDLAPAPGADPVPYAKLTLNSENGIRIRMSPLRPKNSA